MILTKNPKEEYDSYITRVKQNQLARAVKIADIKDNLDLTRIAEPTEDDLARIEKYKRALKELEADDENNQKVKRQEASAPAQAELEEKNEESTSCESAKEDDSQTEAMANDQQDKAE